MTRSTSERIPVNEPLLGTQEAEYVAECVRDGWISSAGKFIQEFESRWAEYCGMAHGIAVTNGTAALQIALKSLDLEPGDEVIMPTFTIISCALAVVEAGGTPVLVDSDPRLWTMDVQTVAEKVTAKTRAIMAVHIYGHPVDMDPIWEVAKEHNLAVIEDAAEAHGARYLSGRDSENPTWRTCGGIGDISTFSFYANKLITTGEGGMVLTNDASRAQVLRGLRNLCFLPDRRFVHDRLGYNYRLTNMQAALGVAQINRFGEIVERKRRMGQRYSALLDDISSIQLPTEEAWARQVYWMYGLVLDDSLGIDAKELSQRMLREGVETRPFFWGMHEQPVFNQMGLFVGERYPVAERIARKGLYLPSGLALSDQQQDRVCAVLRRALFD